MLAAESTNHYLSLCWMYTRQFKSARVKFPVYVNIGSFFWSFSDLIDWPIRTWHTGWARIEVELIDQSGVWWRVWEWVKDGWEPINDALRSDEMSCALCPIIHHPLQESGQGNYDLQKHAKQEHSDDCRPHNWSVECETKLSASESFFCIVMLEEWKG